MSTIIFAMITAFALFVWPQVKLWKLKLMIAITISLGAFIVDNVGFSSAYNISSIATVNWLLLDYMLIEMRKTGRKQFVVILKCMKWLMLITICAGIIIPSVNLIVK